MPDGMQEYRHKASQNLCSHVSRPCRGVFAGILATVVILHCRYHTLAFIAVVVIVAVVPVLFLRCCP